uniref:Kazal-like domain-containing protein n=1 Tax=Glossina brevipalpis TaxID=37001 RepID=A0A1A9WZQ3_9MUSC
MIKANDTAEDDGMDCGLRTLGWCRGESCQKHARLKTFVTILACTGFLQGICETYFRISAKQAAAETGCNTQVVEWLLISSGIFQALFATIYAYWAHRLHPISWLSGTIVLQAMTCVIAVIPPIINFSQNIISELPVPGNDLCISYWPQKMQQFSLTSQQSDYLNLIMLFVLQLLLGLSSLAFYTIGLTYIDDNSKMFDSPAMIGITLAAKFFGVESGSLLTLSVDAANLGWWLGWIVIAPAVCVSGILLGLFPKKLPQRVISGNNLDSNSPNEPESIPFIDDPDYGASMKRLFNNKLLMFNVASLMFIKSATINYALQEEKYLQSRFFLAYSEENGLAQELRARFVLLFVKSPAAAISMLIGGLIISKMKLTSRKVAALNISMSAKLLIIFIAFVYIKCNVGPIAGITNGKLQQPYCSRQCLCTPNTFFPVCPENSTVTYFSPCYAGCTQKSTIGNVEIYEGCSCGGTNNYEMNSDYSLRATEGACSAEHCDKMLVVFQVLSVSMAVIFGMTMIGKIIITLRSVLPQDKGIALAVEISFVGLFAFIPAHLAYDLVTRTTCLYWAPQYARCLLHETPKHGNILNILSACLIAIGIFFDILVYLYLKGLNIYNNNVTDYNYNSSLYSAIPIAEQHDVAKTNAVSSSSVSATTTISTTLSGTSTGQPILQHEPKPELIASHPTSSVMDSSSGDSNSTAELSSSRVTYAQIVFPSKQRNLGDDLATNPKRFAVRADVPLHYLTIDDVRSPLNNLQSFNPNRTKVRSEEGEINSNLVSSPLSIQMKHSSKALETDIDAIRPQSPETDL